MPTTACGDVYDVLESSKAALSVKNQPQEHRVRAHECMTLPEINAEQQGRGTATMLSGADTIFRLLHLRVS